MVLMHRSTLIRVAILPLLPREYQPLLIGWDAFFALELVHGLGDGFELVYASGQGPVESLVEGFGCVERLLRYRPNLE